jgi:hypothetical protein
MTADRCFVSAAEPNVDRLAELHRSMADWLRTHVERPEDVLAVACQLTGHAIRWEGTHGPLTVRVNLLPIAAHLEVVRAIDHRRPIGPMVVRLQDHVGDLHGIRAMTEVCTITSRLGRLALRADQPVDTLAPLLV